MIPDSGRTASVQHAVKRRPWRSMLTPDVPDYATANAETLHWFPQWYGFQQAIL
jgi:hypothetical protein